MVPVHQCLELIHAAGYDDVVALEFEGLEEPLNGIQLSYRYLDFFRSQIEVKGCPTPP